MLSVLLLLQFPASQKIIEEVAKRVESAQTITVTVIQTTDEFPRPIQTRWWFKKGGYYRYENAHGILIASPERCWSVKPREKGYKIFPGAQKDWSLTREVGLGSAFSGMPPISEPKQVAWQGKQALRIELDGKKMTKETKLLVFFDRKTHDPLGISANLGSITQVTLFSELKLNPKIDPKMFRFVPPKGWKLVKD